VRQLSPNTTAFAINMLVEQPKDLNMACYCSSLAMLLLWLYARAQQSCHYL
jgi:hypothetical protein